MKHELPINDIIEWDILNWSRLIPLWLPVLNTLSPDSKVLAFGERNGGMSLMLALLGFKVLCTDREGPTEKARELHKSYNVAHLVTYDSFDIVNDSIQDDKFDLIIAKSVIGGLKEIPNDRSTRTFQVQKNAVYNISRMLKSGGHFLSAENMKGSVLTENYRKWKGKDNGWRYLQLKEISELSDFFSTFQTKTFGFLPTSSSNLMINRICFWANRHLLEILPSESKYIVFISATK